MREEKWQIKPIGKYGFGADKTSILSQEKENYGREEIKLNTHKDNNKWVNIPIEIKIVRFPSLELLAK